MGSSSNGYAPRLPQQETKSSTKLLALTDPILGPENLLKTGFAQRASLVARPVAISHKVTRKPKHCASATLIQKTLKNEPKHGPKNGTAWWSHFWDHMRSLVKEQKKKALSWSHFWDRLAVPKMRPQNRKNPQQRPTRATNKKLQLRLFKQPAYRVGTEEARTCEAWFHLTFRPQKWNLKAHMWYQLSPFPSSNVAICDAAPPRQHSPILRYSALLRYSVLCFNSITQCNWHDIETMAE